MLVIGRIFILVLGNGDPTLAKVVPWSEGTLCFSQVDFCHTLQIRHCRQMLVIAKIFSAIA